MVSTALVKADPFELMDRLDDRQVVAEIKGAVLKEWVYNITIGGKTIEGLSKAGIDACASELATKRGEVLREIDFQLIQNPEDVIATVKAGRYAVHPDGKEVLLETVFGVKRQMRKEEIYDRDAEGNKLYDAEGKPIMHLKEDTFVIEKALMKAARNAKKRLIPMDIQQMILREARTQGRVQVVKDNEAPASDAPLCPDHNKPMTKGQYGWYCRTKVGEKDGKPLYCKAKPAEKPAATVVDAQPAPAMAQNNPIDGSAPATAEQWAEIARIGKPHGWTTANACEYVGVDTRQWKTVTQAQAIDILTAWHKAAAEVGPTTKGPDDPNYIPELDGGAK